jgi:gliding motility-associated-like protein
LTEKLKHTLTKLTTLFSFFLLVNHLPALSQAPVAAFTSTNPNGCAPLTVHFTDQSTGSPFSWNWDFGNGQLSNQRNPSAYYSQPGIYTVKLIVKNAFGVDEETKVNYISVAPSPTASFTATLTTACAPATIQFNDQSTIPPGAGTITNWLWDFGDGNTSNLQNPTHTYTATGFYTVSLLITSSTGCQNYTSVGRYIRIVSGINTDFAFQQPGTCRPPFLINFQDQSSGPGTLSYSWDFGNGSPISTAQNPSSSYASAGTYTVKLDVTSDLGCRGSITKNISITGKTTDFNIPPSICIGQTVTFQNNSSPAPVSSAWDFGDGTTSSQINPNKTFLTGGTFTVKLVNNYGNCSDSVSHPVTVITQPAVNFKANDSTSCRAPFTVQFTDLSPTANTWLWDFGDGQTSNLQNPSHTYTSGGTFNVTLTITLPGGCSNTITKSQYIRIGSTTINVANAPTGGCIPFTYNPIATIQSIDSVVSYQWDLGEPGAVYNTQFPTHTYNSAGNYNITLTVVTQTGCTETITIPNGVRTGVRPIVNFSFTPNNVCASVPVQFTDLSTTTPGAIVQWNWEFGDSTFSTVQNPLHVYEDTGTLRIKLIVSNNGCEDSSFQTITVLPPVADFGYRVDCNNRLAVIFSDSSLTDPALGNITYQWNMGDPANSTFTGMPPTPFVYPALGTYNVTLTVTNGACSYTKTKEVILLNESADFTISKNPVCKGEVFTLNATTSDPDRVKDYSWTIGTASIPDTSRSIDYSLFTYGSYDVTLTLEDIHGCLNTRTIPNFVTVSGPVAAFVPNDPGGCVNSTIGFTDQSTPAGTPIVQWTWSYGDGTQQTYSAPPFNHTYAETGSYHVNLIIRDNANCSDTVNVPNAVLITRPVAAFRADTVYCPLAPLQFVDTSSGSGLSYNWNFGDGGSSTLQNPTHIYALGDNQYTVKLRIRDLVGCEDSVTKTNYIKIRSPQAAFDILDSSGICLPLQTTFTFQGINYQSFYWDFGDGGTSTAMNPAHFYNAFGTYTPKLYLIGPGGCIDSAEAVVNAYDVRANTVISVDPVAACNSLTSTFNLATPPGFKFNFYFGDGQIDSSQQTSLTHTYSSPGLYYPSIIFTDRFGCAAGLNSVPVNVYGALPIFDTDKREFCDNGDVFFLNYTLNNDPIVSSVWDFGDGTSSTATEPVHSYDVPGTYIVTLTVTTQNQCTSVSTDTIRVFKTPELSILGRDTICLNTPETFRGQLTLPDSTIAWQWTLGNGSSSQSQDATTTYGNTGNFDIQLIATNKLGCADTIDHTVHVTTPPTAVPVTNPIVILSGGSTPLNMNYTGPIVNYSWLPLQHLDCPSCPLPIANPQFTTKYKVQVEDRYGCRSSGEITVQIICTGQNFFVPNTFSPNGDGSNDVFYLRGTGLFRVKALRVFNRWGEVVFEKREFPVNSPAHGWDGNYKGKPGTADVYVYQLEIICSNGEVLKYSGNIALIR